jgi:hypothetical protein
MDPEVRTELDQLWEKVGGKPNVTPSSVPVDDSTVDAMMEIPNDEWLENRCVYPLSPYLPYNLVQRFERVARKLGTRLIVTHANPITGKEGAHGGTALDILYPDRGIITATLVLLLVEEFPNIQKTSIPEDKRTKAQIISAAVQDSDDEPYHHDVHMHIDPKDQNFRILMHSTIKAAIMAAVGG